MSREAVAVAVTPRRLPLPEAWQIAMRWLSFLEDQEGVEAVDVVGSIRRAEDTVGDIDIVVGTRASRPVIDALPEGPGALSTVFRQPDRAAIAAQPNVLVEVWCASPEQYAVMLWYYTGPRSYSRLIRERARRRFGFILDSSSIRRVGESPLPVKSELQLYETISEPFVRPEQRTALGRGAVRLRAVEAVQGP